MKLTLQRCLQRWGEVGEAAAEPWRPQLGSSLALPKGVKCLQTDRTTRKLVNLIVDSLACASC